MKSYQRQFIEFALSKQVLKFGEFTLKSGRKSPYFFNAGLFNTGRDLALLGRFYAEALVDSGIEFDLLFGPAYKGIPIATTTAVALAEHHDLDLPYCFNRKEAKDHGEGGNLVGSALQGRVMLVDDGHHPFAVTFAVTPTHNAAKQFAVERLQFSNNLGRGLMRETAQRGGRMQQTGQSQCVFLRIRFTFKGSCEMPQRRRGNQLWRGGNV